jgi:hypothetical protein
MAVAVEGQNAVRLVEFNLHPARYAHGSWYAALLDEREPISAVFDAEGRVLARAEPQVSAWLLREAGLAEDMDWEMEEPQKRLWLLDSRSLARLMLELALAMHREWLVRIIDSTRLRALSEVVGAEALRFVVEEVPAGAFHYQAPHVDFDGDLPSGLGMELRNQGGRTLFALLEPAWSAVRGRARFVLDRALALEEVLPLDPTLGQRALKLILERLIPRRFPEWAWCF